MTFLYLDTETLGLELEQDIWEIGYAFDQEAPKAFFVDHRIAGASGEALNMNGYHERCPEFIDEDKAVLLEARLLNRMRSYAAQPDPLVLVGANPAFDAYRITRRWKLKQSEAPWHYRLLDLGAYSMPAMGATAPQSLFAIASWLRNKGHTIPEPDHSAAGDVATAQAVHLALQGLYGARGSD